MTNKLKPCPFCELTPDTDCEDTMYPSHSYKDVDIGEETLLRIYLAVYDEEREGVGYSIHCATTYGGCGANIAGDSKDEAIDKWNRRA